MRPATKQGVAVAPAQPSDAPEMARLHAACFARGWDEESIRRYLGEPACMVVVARRSGAADLGGFLICRASGGEAEILTLAVAREVRRQGVARTLWRTALEQLQARGAARVVLEVGEENAAALALYRALGLREVERRRGYYQGSSGESRQDGLIMACDLETVCERP